MGVAERFYRIVADELGWRKARQSEDLSLPIDLGIAGDDGYDIIVRLFEEFDVDFTDFDADGYFGPEAGFEPISYLIAVVTGEQKQFVQRARRLTVGHMIAVCERKKWFEPPQNDGAG